MKKRNKRQAAVLVEFSMVLPIVVFTFASMIEISRVMLLQHTADAAAYEGARQGMVPGATATQATEAANALLSIAELEGTKVIITPDVITEATSIISVDVEIPIAENCWIIPLLIKDFAVSSSVTLFCERPPVVQLTGVPAIKAKNAKTKGVKDGL